MRSAARVGGALPTLFSSAVASVHRDDLLAKQLFDCLPNLNLVCVGGHLEDVLVQSFGKPRRLLSQPNVANNLCGKVHRKLAIDTLGDLLQSAACDNHLLEAKQVFRVDVDGAHQLHALDVTGGEIGVIRKRL